MFVFEPSVVLLFNKHVGNLMLSIAQIPQEQYYVPIFIVTNVVLLLIVLYVVTMPYGIATLPNVDQLIPILIFSK